MPEPIVPNAQTTADEPVINTGATVPATGTQTEPPAAQPIEKTFTQADVDRIVTNRLKTAVKAELKKLTGESDGTPTVEDLQRQLTEATNRTKGFEASQSIRDYVTDPKNKLSISAANIRAVEKLVLAEIEYDDQGKVSNLKEAVESVKGYAPALFAGTGTNINQGGGTKPVTSNDMNAFIRQVHAGRN